jgi:UDP-N-acetyl-2-amino-2-deoxyglucuronate dehydrogenase
VEIFTAIYRSNRDGRPVKWPLKPEHSCDYDGRTR